MSSVKDRLSLDWLKEARSQQAPVSREISSGSGYSSGLTPNLEDAVIAYGGRMLQALKKQPDGTGYLHDLLRGLGFRLSDALPVVDYLLERGDLEKKKDDPVAGNYLLHLTPKGEVVVARAS